MKEISCIQQYVIDNLINDKRLSVENLIDAVIKTCSTEQFNNILSILIKAQTSCTNKDKVNFVKMNMYISKKDNHTLLFKVRILDKHVGLISNNIDYYSSSDEAIRQLKANITE